MENGFINELRGHTRGTTCMTDVVFCIVPKIEPESPTTGPAVLKQVCENNGYTARVLDLNIDLFDYLRKQNKHWDLFHENDDLFMREWNKSNPVWDQFVEENTEIFHNWIEKFQELKPRYIGLSLLSQYSRSCAITIAQYIRQYMPDVKIIWGGATLDNYTIQNLVDTGFCDHYVIGDGEYALLKILDGSEQNMIHQVMDMDTIPFPNYDDIDWNRYPTPTHRQVAYVTASRGCVKSCTFCNVRDIWPRYTNRSGKHVADEIKYLKERYNIEHVKFTDSLINGNMKAYRELVNVLVEYDLNINWSSQWIVRSETSTLDSDFALAKRSGCIDLEIGIEHFKESIRYHMGKKHTDSAMWNTFNLMKKYRITSSILMIVGYPTETLEDHNYQIAVLRQLYDEGYVFDNTGKRLMFISATPMLLDGEIYDMVEDDLAYYNNARDWAYGDNITKERIRRYQEFNDVIKEKEAQKSWNWLHTKELRTYENDKV